MARFHCRPRQGETSQLPLDSSQTITLNPTNLSTKKPTGGVDIPMLHMHHIFHMLASSKAKPPSVC